MPQPQLEFRVKGLSHHEMAGLLGVWFEEVIGKMLTVAYESKEENEIGVWCLPVFYVDRKVGYIDDKQKEEVWALIQGVSPRLRRARVTAYDVGDGKENNWQHATLTIELPEELRNIQPQQVRTEERRRAWDKWKYRGPLLPPTKEEKRQQILCELVYDMCINKDPWSDDIEQHIMAYCDLARFDLSEEMNQEASMVLNWLETSDCEEMRQASLKVYKLIQDKGSGEYRILQARRLIEEKLEQPECQSMVRRPGFDLKAVQEGYLSMPYRPKKGNYMKFVARVYYDSPSREQIVRIFSCLALYLRHQHEVAKQRQQQMQQAVEMSICMTDKTIGYAKTLPKYEQVQLLQSLLLNTQTNLPPTKQQEVRDMTLRFANPGEALRQQNELIEEQNGIMRQQQKAFGDHSSAMQETIRENTDAIQTSAQYRLGNTLVVEQNNWGVPPSGPQLPSRPLPNTDPLPTIGPMPYSDPYPDTYRLTDSNQLNDNDELTDQQYRIDNG